MTMDRALLARGSSAEGSSVPGAGRGALLAIAAGVVTVLLATVLALVWPRGGGLGAATVVDGSGRTLGLSAQLRPVSLVHFWATWCPPCREEVAKLVRLGAERLGDPDFALLMVAVADDEAAMRAFLTASGGDPDVAFSTGWRTPEALGVEALPSTVLVVDGRIVTRFVGAQDWDRPAVRQRLLAAAARQRANR